MRHYDIQFLISAMVIAVMTSADVHADVIFVDRNATGGNNGTSWKDAYNDLQAGLAESVAGDEIWVAQGVYTPSQTGNRSASFQLKTGVAVLGGFAGFETDNSERDPDTNITTLSGDLAGNDLPEFVNYEENSFNIVVALNTDSTAVLDGFTITSGNSTDGGLGRGAGMYSDLTGDPTIIDCRFLGNIAVDAGAVYVWYGNARFYGCLFETNSALFNGGGVSVVGEGVPKVEFVRCSWHENTADNLAGAIDVQGVNVDFKNCLFMGNSGIDTLRLCCFSIMTMNNCVFAGNSGVYLVSSVETDAFVTNSVFATTDSLAGFSSSSCDEPPNCIPTGSLTLMNSIFWHNGDGSQEDQVSFPDDQEVVLSYNIIQGWDGTYGGVGNNGLDPMFVDPDGPDDIPGTEDDDLRLSPGSPAIDSGDNTAVPADEFDLDGDGDTAEPTPFDLDGLSRFIDDPAIKDTGAGTPPIVDRGPYEFQAALPTCEGDANGDGTVDPLDAGYVLARFDCPVNTGDPACDAADVNDDLVVDPLDMGFVLSRFGVCL